MEKSLERLGMKEQGKIRWR